jgi:hypothetical protein
MYVHIGVTLSREKMPIPFQIASWAYVALTLAWTGFGVFVLARLFFPK